MARLSSDERRDAIVDATLTVARRKGLGATTVRDVAAEMGTSSGLVHHYFDSMDEVLGAAFALAARIELETVEKVVHEADTPKRALVAFLQGYAPVDSDWTFQLWLDAWSEAGRRPVVREISARLNVAWKEVLAGLIIAGVEAGDFECEDPEGAAWRLISLLDGLVLQVVAHRSTVDRPTMIRWARLAAERELGLPEGALVP